MNEPMYEVTCRIWRVVAGMKRIELLGSAICPLFHEAFPTLFDPQRAWHCIRLGSTEYASHLHIARSVPDSNDCLRSGLLTQYVPSYLDECLPMHDATGAIYVTDSDDVINFKLHMSSVQTLLQLLWWFSDLDDLVLSLVESKWNADGLRQLARDTIGSVVRQWQQRLQRFELQPTVRPTGLVVPESGHGWWGAGGPEMGLNLACDVLGGV